MSLELRFFTECNHRVKSEPLVLDSTGIGTTLYPITNAGIFLLEENIPVVREQIIRSATNDIDSLASPLVTNIDLITQEVLYNQCVTIRQYKQSRDYILSNNNLILWLDTATIKPNPGDLYFVSYRISKNLKDLFRVIDTNHIKISSFNLNHSYIIDYTTLPEYCTKCQGPFTNTAGVTQASLMQDIVYGPTGDFIGIQGVEKLKQDLIRAVLVIRGTNPQEPNYGTSIETAIGTAQAGPMFESFLAQEVRNSLGLLQTLQSLQANVQSNVDPSEILSSIVQITALSDQNNNNNPPGTRAFDPTLYTLYVIVQNAANNLVKFFVPLDVFNQQTPQTAATQITASNIIVSTIGRFSAIITWTTNIATDSIIDYGEDDSLSNRETGIFGTNHFITLSGLKPGTLYYFKVVTLNRGLILGVELRTFKTLP